VVFSLFGKKPPPKDAKPAKPQARSARAEEKARAPAPDSSVAPDAIGDLDFTNWAPAAPPPSSPPSFSPPPSAMPSLAPESMAPPSLAPESVAPKSRAPSLPPLSMPPSLAKGQSVPPSSGRSDAEIARRRGVESNLCIEVETGAKDVPPAIEETAILFANGQAKDALARVSEAIAADDLGTWRLQAWLMLFDLYQHLGMRAAFEEKALEFVVKFERSPPAWSDAPPPAPAAQPKRSGSGAGHVALSGALTAASAPHLEQVKKLAEKQPKLRIDFGRLAGIDAGGAQLLLGTFAGIRKAGKELTFAGDATLVKLVGAVAKSGDRSVDPSLWLLLLDVHQQLGNQQAYEDAALEYAITYEVSPPAWENRAPPKAGTAAGGAADAPPPADEAFVIDGEVAGPSEKLLSDLEGYAAEVNPVVIDMLRARRVDFVNAGQLLNVLARIKQAGKSIEIRGANEMIVALFAMMGIREFARLVPRK
jgi:anti-anti-sigma regulatory factor